MTNSGSDSGGFEGSLLPTVDQAERAVHAGLQAELPAEYSARQGRGELGCLTAGLGCTELVVAVAAVAAVALSWILAGAWLGMLVAVAALLVLGIAFGRP